MFASLYKGVHSAVGISYTFQMTLQTSMVPMEYKGLNKGLCRTEMESVICNNIISTHKNKIKTWGVSSESEKHVAMRMLAYNLRWI